LYNERRALFGCFVILLGATLVAASIMHVIEGHAQPDKFGTIPDAMWWAIVTLGTIGYGDVVPVTAFGRVVASITIFAGLIMVALPIGIVATAFADEVHRRDFVVTWGMVARVPLFADLQATEIADIMRLLHAQQVEPGDVIVRRGEPRIPCTSSPPVQWRSSSSTSACGSVLGISSARWRRCIARVGLPPSPRSRARAFWSSTPTICTCSWIASPALQSISVKWRAPAWAATWSRARATLLSK